MHANVIFGGLGYSKKVLQKFTNIYTKGDNIIVPFTFSSMIFGRQYTHYDVLNKKYHHMMIYTSMYFQNHVIISIIL